MSNLNKYIAIGCRVISGTLWQNRLIRYDQILIISGLKTIHLVVFTCFDSNISKVPIIKTKTTERSSLWHIKA